MDDKLLSEMREYSCRTVGPVVYAYAEWIVKEAVQRGIGRVYFLARDGYLPCEAARMICSDRGIALECRYLYCSRASLRLPTYGLSREEARRHLFCGGYCVSARSILSRVGLDESRMRGIIDRLNINEIDKTLNKAEQKRIFEALDGDGLFWKYVLDESSKAYVATLSYLRAEGLFDSDTVAIADSGWSGSMQRSLRILLHSGGYDGRILGFYFGLYRLPRDPLDGEYLTYYFSARHGILRRALFCNNLFECMLSAPHPTTVGYRITGDGVTPVFGRRYSDAMLALIKAQISGALMFCIKEKRKTCIKNEAETRRECFCILRRAMILPTESDARLYAHFLFCDEVSECGMRPLTCSDASANIPDNLFFTRLFRRLTRRTAHSNGAPFWIYGDIALLRGVRKFWFLFNALLWDVLKSLRDSARRK